MDISTQTQTHTHKYPYPKPKGTGFRQHEYRYKMSRLPMVNGRGSIYHRIGLHYIMHCLGLHEHPHSRHLLCCLWRFPILPSSSMCPTLPELEATEGHLPVPRPKLALYTHLLILWPMPACHKLASAPVALYDLQHSPIASGMLLTPS